MRVQVFALFFLSAASAVLAQQDPHGNTGNKPTVFVNRSSGPSSVAQKFVQPAPPTPLGEATKMDPQRMIRPQIGVQPPGTSISRNQFPRLESLPAGINTAKLEPIPTRWPLLKIEPIPAGWPKAKTIPVDDAAAR
jgi:hypothetical protein